MTSQPDKCFLGQVASQSEFFHSVPGAKCTVRVSKHRCSQIFSTHLGGWEKRSPVRRGCGAQPRDYFFDVFL